MPTGFYVVRMKENYFRGSSTSNYSLESKSWLMYMSSNFYGDSKPLYIQSAFNYCEKRLKDLNFSCDGYAPSENLVLQYHGCFFHSCVKCFPDDDGMNPLTKRVHREVRESNRVIEDKIREAGYNLIVTYGCDWFKLAREKQFPLKGVNDIYTQKMTEDEILRKIRDDEMFCHIVCDVRVPREKEHFFAEFPPIFKHAEISRNDIGDFMRGFCEENNLLIKPRTSLIASYFGENKLFSSDLLRWYMRHGLIISNVKMVIDWVTGGENIFSEFCDFISTQRRAADRDIKYACHGNLYKLMGNSVYGKFALNSSKFRNVKYVNGKKLRVELNSRHFVSYNKVGQDLFEVVSERSTIVHNQPLQISVTVYDLSKLRLLEFYYDFLNVYIERPKFCLCTIDTDSFYLAMAEDSLDKIVKKNKLEEYFDESFSWVVRPYCKEHACEYCIFFKSNKVWIQRQCCYMSEKYHNRTLGVFHEECRGQGIIALASKLYCVFDHDNIANNKSVHKGISHKLNQFGRAEFLRVLQTKETLHGYNAGFLDRGESVFRYHQTKIGLGFLYIKREVSRDGHTTYPLRL